MKKDKDTIKELIKDPNWAEVVRLLSGLFDTQDERENFIIDLADTDILLASECKVTSVNKEFEITNSLIDISHYKINDFEDIEISSQIISSYICLDANEQIVNILSNVKKFTKIHKDTFKLFMVKAPEEQILTFLEVVLKMDNKLNKQLLEFVFIVLNETYPSENISYENRIRSIIINLITNPLRKELSLSYFIGNVMLAFPKYFFKFIDKIELGRFLSLHKSPSTKEIYKTGRKLMGDEIETYENHTSSLAKIYRQKFKKLKKQLNNNEFNIDWENLSGHKVKAVVSSVAEKYINLNIDNLEGNFKIRLDGTLSKIDFKIGNVIDAYLNEPDFRGIVWLDFMGFEGPKKTERVFVDCEISKIIPSHIFVKIKNEKRSASIYIGELTEIRLKSIYDFEYNGTKLYIGQKLKAKIISIDEKNRLNLTLKKI